MADNKTVRSEHTKDMTPEELEALQEDVSKMTPEELQEFRNSFDPDEMGYYGEESVEDGSIED